MKAWMVLAVLLLIAVGVVLVIAALAGATGLIQLFTILIIGAGILVLIMLVIVALWFVFFQTKPKDVTKLAEDHLLSSGKLARAGVPALTHGLYVAGDEQASGFRVGRITGYTNLVFRYNRGGTRTETKTDAGDRDFKVDGGIDCVGIEHSFIVKPDTRPLWWAPVIGTKEEIIVAHDWCPVKEVTEKIAAEDGTLIETKVIKRAGKWTYSHSELVGEVKLFGSSLRKVGRYLYIGSQAMDIDAIDYVRTIEAQRTHAHLVLQELHKATEGGMLANAPFMMEEKLKQEIPVFGMLPQPKGIES